MSTFPASPSFVREVADSDSPSAASYKRKRGSSEESTTSNKRKRNSSDESDSEEFSSENEEEEDLDDGTPENSHDSRDYTDRRSICHLKDLLEETKTLPESDERSANIKDLEELTKALDSYDFKGCRKYQKCIDQNDLKDIIEMAAGEQFVEKLIRDGLRRAESKPPKNEDVARALSYFMGPSGEAEVKQLVAAVTNKMCALGEDNDEDILRRNAEPEIIDLIINWRDEERRAGLEKVFKFNSALW
ncbi:uncharacterized protein M437DRAFT_63285 [Aureobasidium melanogenum CBS 110374]|uniref:Uncharacterized protein n=1 Tax=Aureobasidium melanogenum (strain CBS 110374) TaxID=1043003 RepID=A0A074VY51_AURM1|nr:uncharacterized protein M437DRAFT_63285 [Aureobasidium melanogenum CBS 110374]KEQ65735.1 hypothetical protein M437DRAFT_63285 [Aureobasidium melanogenum CBS 110374]